MAETTIFSKIINGEIPCEKLHEDELCLAFNDIASGIKKISNEQTGIILITHYQRLLDEIQPDYVHVMADGQIIKTGKSDLALELEKNGYEWTDNFIKEQ